MSPKSAAPTSSNKHIHSCGWGSGALYFAEKLPKSKITAFSNSKTQKIYIDSVAKEKGLENLTVLTGNVVDYEFEPESFDRVVSIEVRYVKPIYVSLVMHDSNPRTKMFEHMKNYELLMAKISRALKVDGKLFVHIFAHKTMPYDFEDGWMATHFFSGGTMPSVDLLLYFQNHLKIQKQWWINGRHYSQTCEVSVAFNKPASQHTCLLTLSQDWLKKMTSNKSQIWPHFVETYGEDIAPKWYNRWQIFYLACSELFAFGKGDTWGVAHYLFEKTS